MSNLYTINPYDPTKAPVLHAKHHRSLVLATTLTGAAVIIGFIYWFIVAPRMTSSLNYESINTERSAGDAESVAAALKSSYSTPTEAQRDQVVKALTQKTSSVTEQEKQAVIKALLNK